MPYLKPEDRDRIYNEHSFGPPQTAGELNYLITQLINMYMKDKVKNYALFNSVVGALESCKLEYFRRVVAPAENAKIEENGDVW